MNIREAYIIFVVKIEANDPFGGPRRKLETILNWTFTNTGFPIHCGKTLFYILLAFLSYYLNKGCTNFPRNSDATSKF